MPIVLIFTQTKHLVTFLTVEQIYVQIFDSRSNKTYLFDSCQNETNVYLFDTYTNQTYENLFFYN